MNKNAGPVAPRDPEKKRPYFYLMSDKEIFAAPQPDGRGIQFIYEDDGRMITAAKLVGNIEDEEMLDLLKTTAGFRKLVHSIGVSVSAPAEYKGKVRFVLQMYGVENPYETGTNIFCDMEPDGSEVTLFLEDVNWGDMDAKPGQIRFEFEDNSFVSYVNVRFYLNDGFTAPEPVIDSAVDFDSDEYAAMIKRSVFDKGNLFRLRRAIDKAERGEEVTIACIGGSITQGAGAIPINEKSYARLFAKGFEETYSKPGNVRFIKAGVGGTPSELGMIRYERDVLRDGSEKPDIVVIEFAVNDEGDETKGDSYGSLIRKVYTGDSDPAVILLFLVFANDWNLQERLSPMGRKYSLPMVSVLDAVSPQFPLPPKKAGEENKDTRVISKSQYFYDVYHPTNLGHRVNADCLLEMCKCAEESNDTAEPAIPEKEEKDSRFSEVFLLDKKEIKNNPNRFACVEEITEGCFDGTDSVLHCVEMDMDLEGTPEFPYNWHSAGGMKKDAPFTMKIRCKRLLLVMKDTADVSFGTAVIKVDGKEVKSINPNDVGWCHCSPHIIIDNDTEELHTVEIGPADGSEDKLFTILGFGIVS
ncbi:MAG: SGNH/GDSL hydrolase family protein [Lachnospiraceae bacterium]|nr:SGNH/GDSL hydrolase family protein [Lachnospiraceae bacterium]